MAQPNDQSVLGNVECLRLRPDAFLQGDRAVALHGEQKPHRVVFDLLEVFFAGAPAVSCHESRLKPPGQYFLKPVLKVIVLGLFLGLVVNPVIHRQAAPLRIGVMQRDQV
jgi:hypothetical protein